MEDSHGEVTVLLGELKLGNKDALERLMPLAGLRHFGGLSVEETAEAMAISARTVKRDWAMAKAWMKTQLESGGSQ